MNHCKIDDSAVAAYLQPHLQRFGVTTGFIFSVRKLPSDHSVALVYTIGHTSDGFSYLPENWQPADDHPLADDYWRMRDALGDLLRGLKAYAPAPPKQRGSQLWCEDPGAQLNWTAYRIR